MESTEKKPRGKIVVFAILVLATAAAAMTWMRYTAQAPSTREARLVSDRVVIATFSARASRNIREGSQAVVTFEGLGVTRLSGTVQSLRTQDSHMTAVIILKDVPRPADLQTRCDVTVDTSVDSQALRVE